MTIEVTQDGLLPTTYRIKLAPGIDNPVQNGVYHMVDYGDESNLRFYECIDGKGFCKMLESGKTEEFTYEQTPEGKLRFAFADRTEEYEYCAYSDGTSSSFSLYDDAKPVGYGSMLTNRCLETSCYFSKPETLQYAKEYYANELGKPDVKMTLEESLSA